MGESLCRGVEARALLRVIHIVESLNRGAVENWLVRMLRHARHRGVEVDWTFYCTVGQPGVLDEEARSLGARVIHSPVPIGRKVQFVRGLRAAMRSGSYDVLHCHHDLLSAVYLLASVGMRLTRRIVHVHNADEDVLTPSRVKQRLLREPLRRVCLSMADRIVGNSGHSLDTFLAGRVRRVNRDIVHHYGVDPTRFERVLADRSACRRQLGLPEGVPILLFAGRVVPEKNPAFVVDVLAELRRLEPRAVAVFAGAGSEERAVRARAREHGLEQSVRLLGWRSDLPEVMSCCDWYILPHPEHRMEGFGIAVLEAQLAGLRMLLSCGVPDDPLLASARFRRLSLSAGPSAWAEAAKDLLTSAAPSRTAVLEELASSSMDMTRALDGLIRLHE